MMILKYSIVWPSLIIIIRTTKQKENLQLAKIFFSSFKMALRTLYRLAYALTWETITGKTPKNLAFTGNFLSEKKYTNILKNSALKWDICYYLNTEMILYY